MKLIMNARLSDDFEKAIYKKAIEVAVNKIRSNGNFRGLNTLY